MQAPTLGEVIKTVRVSVVAHACGLSPKAVYKWIERGSLPRTEFTGETGYAKLIAEASNGKFSQAEILQISQSQSLAA